MPRVSKTQVTALERDFGARSRQREAADMLAHLQRTAPEVMSPYSGPQQTGIADDVLQAAATVGITDQDIILNWGYIRFATGLEFYKMAEFKDILEQPYLHPDARGRHIVLAFHAIQGMKGKVTA